MDPLGGVSGSCQLIGTNTGDSQVVRDYGGPDATENVNVSGRVQVKLPPIYHIDC